MKIIAVAGQKGGVGKTTTVMNLAATLARADAQVIVVDVDPQQSATWWASNAGDDLPFDFAADVDPVNLGMLRKLEYDYVLIDTPGSLEDTVVLDAVLDVSDFVILPLNPEPLNVPAFRRTVKEHINPRGLDYRVLLSKIERNRHGQLEDWEQLVDGGLHMPRFEGHIRKSASTADSPLAGKVVTQFTDTRANQAAIFDYTRVSHELRQILHSVDADAVVKGA
jgi:chromosome partitioning protein